MEAINRFWNSLRAWWKWALSFDSHNWELQNYPVYVRRSSPDPDSEYDDNPRFAPHSYFASIINWNVSGFGDTKLEALRDLAINFANRKAKLAEEGKPLPRPGTVVPIQFASQERISVHPELTQDFIERVLGLDWAFVTDESSLWDFHSERTNEHLVEKIRCVYSVGVDDLESAKLWEILDRIALTKV